MSSAKVSQSPDNWRAQAIGQLAETYAGGTPPRSAKGMFGGSIPWVKSTELSQGVIRETEESLTELGFNSSSAKWVPENTSLIAMYGATAGVVGWLRIYAVTNQAVLAVIPFDSTDARWLYWALDYHAPKMLTSVQGSGQPNLSKTLIDQVEMLCPPLPEQRRIAEVLDAADEAIRQTERVIAKLRQVKAGQLHDLLTRGLDADGNLRDPQAHPEQFKDSPLGKVPREWEVKTLGETIAHSGGFIQTGPFGSQLHADEYTKEGFPVIMPQDIGSRRVSVDQIARIPVKKANTLARHQVAHHDVIFARRGDLSRCASIGKREQGWLCGTGCLLVRPPGKVIDGDWLAAIYQHDRSQRQIAARAVGSTMVNLNTSLLASLVIARPCYEEQMSIVEVINAHNARIHAEETQLAKLRQVKRGLMDDLLTGRVRVV